ncbi:MAG: toxin Doc, partial [Streptomyces sp.]|nr:toxin Doc [Streptomyces sp.]
VSGVGMDPPYGALVDLVRDLIDGKADVYAAADRLRSWQI